MDDNFVDGVAEEHLPTSDQAGLEVTLVVPQGVEALAHDFEAGCGARESVTAAS
jgi:hypothetical protein